VAAAGLSYNPFSMGPFLKGLELSRLYYTEAVKSIIDRRFPRLRYSAGVIGWGSEVLGYDDKISTDHHWGPRLLLFLSDRDHERLAGEIGSALANELPLMFRGYSTNFGSPEPNGVRLPVAITTRPVDHMVQCFTIRDFFNTRLGVDPSRKFSSTNWLGIPQQRLLEVTSGAVYHDGLGRLEQVRQKLGYYPRDVWLYLLASQWKKISQEEAFVGRAGSVGDELGSRVVGARIVREMMLLCFLMERRYAPYSKWLGTAFSQLELGRKLRPYLYEILAADDWKTREANLSRAYSVLAAAHNKLEITGPMPTRTSNYFGRPFKVIHADAFAVAIRGQIQSSSVRRLRPHIGSIDQFVDNTDVLSNTRLCQELAGTVFGRSFPSQVL
jgi:hypothetical protein